MLIHRLPLRALSVCLGALLVLITCYVVRAWRTDSNFRNNVKSLLFELSASDEDRTLLLLGDSRIVSMSCPSDFSGWRVLNLGVSGSTASDWSAYLLARAKLRHFDAAILWVGINDILNFGRAASSVVDDEVSLVSYLDNIAQRVALINPTDTKDGSHEEISERIYERMRQLANLPESGANSERVSIITPFESSSEDNRGDFYADYVHLNEGGYRVLCAQLGKWLANNG
jgi:lysophospholipase L1-like esterase